MINKLIFYPLAKKLNNYFKVKYPDKTITIYNERSMEKFNKPCIFIWRMNTDQEKVDLVNNQRIYQMQLRYHTDEVDELYNNLNMLDNDILTLVQSIDMPIGDLEQADQPTRLVRGQEINSQIVDDVLQVFVSYLIHLQEPSALPNMQNVDYTDHIKEN